METPPGCAFFHLCVTQYCRGWILMKFGISGFYSKFSNKCCFYANQSNDNSSKIWHRTFAYGGGEHLWAWRVQLQWKAPFTLRGKMTLCLYYCSFDVRFAWSSIDGHNILMSDREFDESRRNERHKYNYIEWCIVKHYEVPNAKSASVNSVFNVTEQTACSLLYWQGANWIGASREVCERVWGICTEIKL
jgi:hypothetical protein